MGLQGCNGAGLHGERGGIWAILAIFGYIGTGQGVGRYYPVHIKSGVRELGVNFPVFFVLFRLWLTTCTSAFSFFFVSFKDPNFLAQELIPLDDLQSLADRWQKGQVIGRGVDNDLGDEQFDLGSLDQYGK